MQELGRNSRLQQLPPDLIYTDLIELILTNNRLVCVTSYTKSGYFPAIQIIGLHHVTIWHHLAICHDEQLESIKFLRAVRTYQYTRTSHFTHLQCTLHMRSHDHRLAETQACVQHRTVDLVNVY